MFGHDDNQQPTQDTNTVMDAAMPEPLGDDNTASSAGADTGNPSTAPSMSTPPSPSSGLSAPSSISSNPTPSFGGGGSGEDLLDLKQKALQHLSPLVSQLDQTPEEKFRTTMMMIQASDDKTLVKTAFEAAQAITDDKTRAQALLDIINEINYFTQHQQ